MKRKVTNFVNDWFREGAYAVVPKLGIGLFIEHVLCKKFFGFDLENFILLISNSRDDPFGEVNYLYS